MRPKITLCGTESSEDTLRTRRRLEARGIPYDFIDIAPEEENPAPSESVGKPVPVVEICGTVKRLSRPEDDDQKVEGRNKSSRRKVRN